MSPQLILPSHSHADASGAPSQPISVGAIGTHHMAQPTQPPHYLPQHQQQQHPPQQHQHQHPPPLPPMRPRGYSLSAAQPQSRAPPSMQMPPSSYHHHPASPRAHRASVGGIPRAIGAATYTRPGVTSPPIQHPRPSHAMDATTAARFEQATTTDEHARHQQQWQPHAASSSLSSVAANPLHSYGARGTSVSGASGSIRAAPLSDGMVDVMMSDTLARSLGKPLAPVYKAERKQNSACDICRQRKVRCVRVPGAEKCANCLDKKYPCTDEMTRRYLTNQATNKKGPKRSREVTEGLVQTSGSDLSRQAHSALSAASSPPEMFVTSTLFSGAKIDIRQDPLANWEPNARTVSKLVYQVVAVTTEEDDGSSRQWPVDCVRLREDAVNSVTKHELGTEGESTPIRHLPVTYNASGATWNQVNRPTSHFQTGSPLNARLEHPNSLQHHVHQGDPNTMEVSPDWVQDQTLRATTSGTDSIHSDYFHGSTGEQSPTSVSFYPPHATQGSSNHDGHYHGLAMNAVSMERSPPTSRESLSSCSSQQQQQATTRPFAGYRLPARATQSAYDIPQHVTFSEQDLSNCRRQ